MSNKRQKPRAAVDVYVNKIMDEELFMCRATDISSEGIYLSSLIEPDLDGRQVGVEFALTRGGEVMWATGEIVREGLRGGTRGSGIRFTAIPDTYKELIDAFIARSSMHGKRKKTAGARKKKRAVMRSTSV